MLPVNNATGSTASSELWLTMWLSFLAIELVTEPPGGRPTRSSMYGGGLLKLFFSYVWQISPLSLLKYSFQRCGENNMINTYRRGLPFPLGVIGPVEVII